LIVPVVYRIVLMFSVVIEQLPALLLTITAGGIAHSGPA
jgi:hypothetical protein